MLLLGLACLPATGTAQGLEYTSTTQLRLSAAFGAMASAAGGGQAVSLHAFLQGARLRLETGAVATIIDADRGEILMLDNARRTYQRTPLSSMAQPLSDSVANAAGAVLSVVATRDVQAINGVPARRTDIVVRLPARNPKAPRANDLVVVHQIWTSNSNAIGSSYDRIAAAAERFGAAPIQLLAMVAQEPRAASAMQKAAKAAANVRGMPVRRVVAYGNVPVGKVFKPGMALDTLMRVTTDITNIKNASVPASMFQVPPGYVAVERR